MEKTSTRQYDLFKLTVAIVLFLIFLCLILWTTRQDPSQPPTFTPPAPTDTATASPAAPSPESTATPNSAPTATPPPAATITPEPVPTATAEPTSDPDEESPTEVSYCETIIKSRLKIGMDVIILKRLNFRSTPGIYKNRITTNTPGTPAEVVGGPACTRYRSGGAYLWWQIKLPDGAVGWSAEASVFGTYYFIEPAQ